MVLRERETRGTIVHGGDTLGARDAGDKPAGVQVWPYSNTPLDEFLKFCAEMLIIGAGFYAAVYILLATLFPWAQRLIDHLK